jgi:hypothetical protein
MKKKICSTLFIFLLFVSHAFAVDVLVWGPTKYTRTSGSPNIYTETISGINGQVKLSVKNGSKDGDDRVQDSLSSATINVNGVRIFGPDNFNKQVYLLEADLDLAESMTLSIELASGPGSYLTIEFLKDVVLPPDPGEEGKQTLLGIDSENDGVRDDIQRYIYFTYPRDEKLRLALFQIARDHQDAMLHSADPEISYENVKKLNRSRLCLYYLKGGVHSAMNIQDALFAEIHNTKERSQAYLKFNNNLAGKTATLPLINEWKNCCSFNVD